MHSWKSETEAKTISEVAHKVSTVNSGHLFHNKHLLRTYYVSLSPEMMLHIWVKGMFCQQPKMSMTKQEETLDEKWNN